MVTVNTSISKFDLPLVQKRAAIYIRVSSDRQEEDGTSLESQEARSLAYCRERGYIVDTTRHMYREVYTGTVYRERPKLSKLRFAARKREFDIVVVYAYDRLARKQVHQAVLIDELEHHGITVECVTEQFEDSPLGTFMRNAAAFVAETEREKILERTERGRRTRIESGKLLGGGSKALYGYSWADPESRLKTSYVINEQEAAVVREIFLQAAAGVSLDGIARSLTEQRIPTPSGKTLWRRQSVHMILTNPFYTGEAVVYKQHIVKKPGQPSHRIQREEAEQVKLPEGVVPSIIDTATFALVQKQLDRNKQIASRNNSNPQDALLRCGYIYCGYCGRKMAVTRSRTPVNYTCNKGREKHERGACVWISARILDTAAWKRAVEIIKDPKLVAQKLEQQKQKKAADDEYDPLARIEQRLNEIEAEMQNIVELSQTAPYKSVLETAGRLLGALEREKQVLAKERDELAELDKKFTDKHEAILAFEQSCATMRVQLEDPTFEPSYDFKRQAIEYFGIKAVVWLSDHHPPFIVTANPPDLCPTRSRISEA